MKEVPVGNTFALVDDGDYELVTQAGPWTLVTWRNNQYAKRRVRDSDDAYPSYSTLAMHTVITGWDYVDHIDGNGLNNQRSNLRWTTHAENIQNQRVQARSKSGYRGVSYFPMADRWLRKKPWRARIKVDGHDRTIGYFVTKEEAARAWNEAALEAWGPYARLNKLTEERR